MKNKQIGKYYSRKSCRFCGEKKLVKILNFGNVPLAGAFIEKNDIENEKYSFDFYNGHPEMSGYYHYHTNTKGPLEVLEHKGLITNSTPGSSEIEVYGIMCDGTVILGCTELDGSSPNSVELDAQNGHIHDLIDGEGTTHFTERYHTHICPDQFSNHKFTPELQYYDYCNRSF